MYVHAHYAKKDEKLKVGSKVVYVVGSGEEFTFALGKIVRVLGNVNYAYIFVADKVYRNSPHRPSIAVGEEITVEASQLWVERLDTNSKRKMLKYTLHGMDMLIPAEHAHLGNALIMPNSDIYMVVGLDGETLKLAKYKIHAHRRAKIEDIFYVYGIGGYGYTMRIDL